MFELFAVGAVVLGLGWVAYRVFGAKKAAAPTSSTGGTKADGHVTQTDQFFQANSSGIKLP